MSARLVPWRLSELWDYRELLAFLVWRDISIKYKQTLLGVAWAVAQPVMATVVFSVVFGRLAQLPSDGVPYPLFSFVGLLAWNLVSGGIARAAVSLVGSASLITKVYFPRLLVPAAATLGGTLDFVVSLALTFVLTAYFGVAPSATLIALPLFLLLAIMAALGIGLWLAAINTRYRDVSHVVPFAIQLWLYASPVAYSIELVPGDWRFVYALNPMVGILAGFRWALLGVPIDAATVGVSFLVTLVLLITGLTYFRSQEQTMADVI